jgi:tRNA 2-thiouridine synthesizing protein A
VLRDRIFSHIARRSCYSAGWAWANQEEGFEKEAYPECLWPPPSMDGMNKRQTESPSVQDKTRIGDMDSKFDAEWDAGDMGCGDLVLELRIRVRSLEPGQVLKVLAKDEGAKEDLPAWCRVTGNALVASCHPVYLIRRKGI